MVGRIHDSVWDLVGHTPLVRLSHIPDQSGAHVLCKLEAKNPSGSVKDRAAHAMIEAAERAGILRKGATIVEATSGNTGISLAMLSAVRGYRCTLVMPEDMSSARQTLLRAYGAELVLTAAADGMRGAVEEAERIVARQRRRVDAAPVRQSREPARARAHDGGRDLRRDFGRARRVRGRRRHRRHADRRRAALRARGLSLKVYAIEPKSSAVLSGGAPGLHAIQGLGAGSSPRFSIDRRSTK